MSTSNTKLNDLCDDLEGCNLGNISDEELFKQPPPLEDCPICMIRLPTIATGRTYMNCCGKVICRGCHYAPVYDDQGNEVDSEKCAFCRTPFPASESEMIERYKLRVKANDAEAIFNMGQYHSGGEHGFEQDYTKALEHWHRASEFGHAAAYYNIGVAHSRGDGVEEDSKNAIYYYKLAAIRGDINARYTLGNNEWRANNIDKAVKHYQIAARGGCSDSLCRIRELYSNGETDKKTHALAVLTLAIAGEGDKETIEKLNELYSVPAKDTATKEDYHNALRSYQVYLSEIKSSQRDKVNAIRGE